MMRARVRSVLKRTLPQTIYKRLVHITRYPPVGELDFGDLRTLKPISDVWGLDRGLPIDRYYIEEFMRENSAHIKGHVLEIGDNIYTANYGQHRVEKSDILDISPENDKATIVADLAMANQIQPGIFDCIICPQTLHYIHEIDKAIFTLERILKNGGVLLATLPGIHQINQYEMDQWGDYWRFTSASAERLFSKSNLNWAVKVSTYGNVLAAIAFLHGIAAGELDSPELDYRDPNYQLLICIRAEKVGNT